MARISTVVPPIAPGSYPGAQVVVLYGRLGRRRVFVKVGDQVFIAGLRELDLGVRTANENERRAWCKLAGVKLADLKRAIAADAVAAEKRQGKDAAADLKHEAARLGFRLVKTRKPKGA